MPDDTSFMTHVLDILCHMDTLAEGDGWFRFHGHRYYFSPDVMTRAQQELFENLEARILKKNK